MAQNYDGTEGTSGLAARAEQLGLADPHAPVEAPATPVLDPALGTDQSQTGALELETAQPPDFVSQVAAHMAAEAEQPTQPGSGNEWVPAEVPTGDTEEAPLEVTAEPVTDGTEGDAPPVVPSGPPPLPWLTGDTTPLVTLDGQAFSEREVRMAFDAARQQATMTPQQVMLWNELMAGRAQIIPAGQTATPVDDTDEYIDPRAQAEDARLTQALAAQQEQLRYLQHQEAERARLHEETKVTSAIATVRARYNLPDTDPALADRLASAAMPFVQYAFSDAKSQGVDTAAIYEWGLEQAVWQTPEFRDAIVAAQVQTKLDDTLLSDEVAQARRRKGNASSLAGSSQGSVPRTAPPARDPRTLSEAETRAAIAHDLRATMNQ